MVATDVAARGLDIPSVDLVVLASPPREVETYIHRSGRTGRAGRKGTCLILYPPEARGTISSLGTEIGTRLLPLYLTNSNGDASKAALDRANAAAATASTKVTAQVKTHLEELARTKGPDALLSYASQIVASMAPATMEPRSMLTSAAGYRTYGDALPAPFSFLVCGCSLCVVVRIVRQCDCVEGPRTERRAADSAERARKGGVGAAGGVARVPGRCGD
jgi:superfamily II DNA/RNA helicase